MAAGGAVRAPPRAGLTLTSRQLRGQCRWFQKRGAGGAPQQIKLISRGFHTLQLRGQQALRSGHSKVGSCLVLSMVPDTMGAHAAVFPPSACSFLPLHCFLEARRSFSSFWPFPRFDLNWATLEISRGGDTAMDTDTVITQTSFPEDTLLKKRRGRLQG